MAFAQKGFKPKYLKPPGHYLCTHEPGRLGCVISIQKGIISIQKGVNGDAYPVAISQKVMKNISFYSPTPGFKEINAISSLKKWFDQFCVTSKTKQQNEITFQHIFTHIRLSGDHNLRRNLLVSPCTLIQKKICWKLSLLQITMYMQWHLQVY